MFLCNVLPPSPDYFLLKRPYRTRLHVATSSRPHPLTKTHGVIFQKIWNLSNSADIGPNLANISTDKIMREIIRHGWLPHRSLHDNQLRNSREDPKILQRRTNCVRRRRKPQCFYNMIRAEPIQVLLLERQEVVSDLKLPHTLPEAQVWHRQTSGCLYFSGTSQSNLFHVWWRLSC
jgi:hypothetical protein